LQLIYIFISGGVAMKELELDSIDVARHIAYLCSLNGFEYNNTKIQKLLYVCYGVFLAKKNQRLVNEHPQAWPYGPVFPKVFKYISSCEEDYRKRLQVLDDDVSSNLDKIIICFGEYSAGKLSAWSHNENSPWDSVIDKDNPKWSVEIPDEIIKKYFSERIIKNADAK
jgi:uncharacterized phage-associated protein